MTEYPIDLASLGMRKTPYPHLVADSSLVMPVADRLLNWFESRAVWQAKSVRGFYDSDDIDLRTQALPPELSLLTHQPACDELRRFVEGAFIVRLGERVDVTAHRLRMGQRIAVHTDHGEVPQTHRLLIQLNRGWVGTQGGLMMMFGELPASQESWMPERTYLPIHGSAVCFEVSSRSWHAVSEVYAGERYTLCLSFYQVRANDSGV